MSERPTDHLFRSSVAVSFAGHASLIGGILTLALWKSSGPATIDFEIIENPKVSGNARPIEMAKPKPVEKAQEKRAVFGLSKNAATAPAGADAPSVKLGNTVAKENDDKKLNKDDADSLPIPTDEYLVSEMPKLLTEVRIPYPEEAKKASVQGSVLFDLLIDGEGKVRELKLIRGPGFGLNEAAGKAILNFQFSPARVQNKPVAVRIRYAYRFILQR